MADAWGDIAIAATGLKDSIEFDELIAGYSFGFTGKTFQEPGKCENGEYFARTCGELYPSVFPRDDEEENVFYKEEFVSAVQEHLRDDGRVVIACSYREKFRYMGAEKLFITKTDSKIEFVDTNFLDAT